jgi:sugar lactone lactonase YvrE
VGYKDGQGLNAAFDLITGMCADKDGNLYVVDNLNCCIRKIDTEGNVTTLAGIGDDCGYVDGDAKTAKFNLPMDICLDSKGNFYVTDAGNKKIRIIKPK